MSIYRSKHKYKVYRGFKALDPTDHRAVIAFFDYHQQAIKHLELEEYVEILFAYTNALFNAGHHGRFLRLVQHPLELIIEHNIHFYEGEDIYTELLFKKGAAHYNLGAYSDAEKVLMAVLSICPSHYAGQVLLQKCKLKYRPKFILSIRAVCVVMYILSALVIAIEVFTVRTFYTSFIAAFVWARNTLFFGGLFLLICSEVYFRTSVYLKVFFFCKKALKVRSQKIESNTFPMEDSKASVL